MDQHFRSCEAVIPPSKQQPSRAPPPTQQLKLPNPHGAHPAQRTTAAAMRPLSDIRELSEPSLMDVRTRQSHSHSRHNRSASRASTVRRIDPFKIDSPIRTAQQHLRLNWDQAERLNTAVATSSSYSSTPPEHFSYFDIPSSNVPRRSSSQNRSHPLGRSHGRQVSLEHLGSTSPPPPPPPALPKGFTIPNRGRSESPVKEARLRTDPATSDADRRVPSRTHVRCPQPVDILEFPVHKHPRLKLQLHVSAPVFVGGGSIEGEVRITVDNNESLKHRRSLSIGAVSVDLLGFESLGHHRKSTFLSLGTELIDSRHPPPPTMIQPPNPLFADDAFWSLTPSHTTMPFMISLPLDTGPPPFHSKNASIRFVLGVTTLVRDAGKLFRVRSSQDVFVLPTYDPERALSLLPSPLAASDALALNKGGLPESLRVTAGLHRQVWVSGSSIFVDVHIANKCHKPVRKMELMLERNILCYKHVAATTTEIAMSHARVFEINDQTAVVRTSFKAGDVGWTGVGAHASDTRTCELEVPRGHATVRCGKFFEVRYFLSVTASLSSAKSVSVQLPVILIHMNSLDVVPNSVAQVAAAMEEKRTHRQLSHKPSRSRGMHVRQRSWSSPARAASLRRQPSYSQGRAFTAPRQQSLDRQRDQRADLEELRNILDSSPRKQPRRPINVGAVIGKFSSHASLRALRSAQQPGKTYEAEGVISAVPHQPSPRDRKIQDYSSKTTSNYENAEPWRARLYHMRSFDSIRSVRSMTPGGPMRQASGPSAVLQPSPPTLGVAMVEHKTSMDLGSERPATRMSFREKRDRNRFEVHKVVRRKGSGGLRERGMNWWESRKGKGDQQGRPGWI